MNQKCLGAIFVPMQPLNFNANPPSVCQKHQKPLSYYNKYKPNNDPICLDCLLNEIKEEESNLYLPISNLEQEYYSQKNAFHQIIEQANSMKKYEKSITNFQNLLTNYLSQFIELFLKEKILSNISQKKVDFYEKNKTCCNPKDIMNILYKVENDKYNLDNKTTDAFCIIKKMQTILLNSHEQLAKSFKDLLNGFFYDSKNEFLNEKENMKENISNKTHSNKKCFSNSSVPSNSSRKSQDIFTSTKNESKTPNEDNISPISQIDDLKGNLNDKTKEISNFSSKININMEKEKIFEENIEFEIEDEKKSIHSNELNNSFSIKNNSELSEEKNNERNSEDPKEEHELEWRKKKSDEEELAWRKKKSDEEDDICREHKDKINKLIEKDKNKKTSVTNSSFYHKRKSNFKKKPNLNKSFQKYNPNKFNFSKKIEYKQYNQFIQKTCRKCCCSFLTTKDEEFCQNCKYISDDDERLNKMGPRDFFNKKSKYGFFPKNFVGPKKPYIQPQIGNKKFFGKKNENKFSHNFANKSMIHSNSNFLNHYGKRINSPKGFEEFKMFNNNGKNKIYRGKENYDDNHGKNSFGCKKYYEKRIKDDFEVDLESDEENNINNNQENNENNKKIPFCKTINDFFIENSLKKREENEIDENENDSIDDNEKKNNIFEGDFFDKKSEKMSNNENSDDSNQEDDEDKDNGFIGHDDFEADF